MRKRSSTFLQIPANVPRTISTAARACATSYLYKTNFRKSIPAAKRLVITLRYLSRGIPQETRAYNFRVGCSTVAGIFIETCDVIYKVLSPIYLRPPSSEEEWKLISSEFNELWNMPHVLGAIDGKQINIECQRTQAHNTTNTKLSSRKYCWQYAMQNINSSSLTYMIYFLAKTYHLYNNSGFACCHGHHCYNMVTKLRKHQMEI